MMKVMMTSALRSLFEADGLDADLFMEEFASWKAGDEYGHYLFGKDSAYHTPAVDGEKNKLRHVHLVPLTDQKQLADWNKKAERGSRKTSDRALVYVSDGPEKHLLIFILNEPDAHNIAKMTTTRDADIMNGFAEVAAEFIATGNVAR